MLGESHQLLQEFPEHAHKIADLRANSDAFHHLMDEYDWLDSHIRRRGQIYFGGTDKPLDRICSKYKTGRIYVAPPVGSTSRSCLDKKGAKKLPRFWKPFKQRIQTAG